MEGQHNSIFNVDFENFDSEHLSILYLKGTLDAHTAQALENQIQSFLSNGIYRFVMNLRYLDYISSAGLGVFMAFVEEVRNNNGDIKFSEVKPNIYTIFELLGFPLIFDFVDTNELALKMFRDNQIRRNDL